MFNILDKRTKILLIITGVILLIAIPLTVIISQKQQELRQHAASPTSVSFEASLTSITIKPGEQFSIDINFINTDPPKAITAFEIPITYNANALNYVSFTAPANLQTATVTKISDGSLRYVWLQDPDNIINLASPNIKLATLQFMAKPDSSGKSVMIDFSNPLATDIDNPTGALSVANNKPLQYTITSGGAAAPAQPAAVQCKSQQTIIDIINQNCGEDPTDTCRQQYGNAPGCIVRTPTPIPGAASGSNSCTANGNWCLGTDNPSVGDKSKGICDLAPGFSCTGYPSWSNTCWSCTARVPTPGQTSTPTSRGYNNTSTGNSQSTGAAPTYSPGPTSIPAGYITLYFNVTLPGMSPTMTTAPITATLYQGSSPIGPFSNISLTRQTNSDIFTGDSGTKIRISDIAVGQDYYVEVKAQSYEKQIITGGEQKNPQGLRTVFNNSTLPSVKLRPGDIDGNGTIDGADYGILVACFGNKNIFTGATGRTDCGNKTNNGQFNPDINKDGKVVGDDINLLWRAVNGTL